MKKNVFTVKNPPTIKKSLIKMYLIKTVVNLTSSQEITTLLCPPPSPSPHLCIHSWTPTLINAPLKLQEIIYSLVWIVSFTGNGATIEDNANSPFSLVSALPPLY